MPRAAPEGSHRMGKDNAKREKYKAKTQDLSAPRRRGDRIGLAMKRGGNVKTRVSETLLLQEGGESDTIT